MAFDKRRPHPHASNVLLGEALHRLLLEAAMSNAELARRTGVDGSTVGRFIRGDIAITVEHVASWEDALNLPRGRLYVESGLIDPDELGIASVETAIAADRALDRDSREILTRTYRRLASEPTPAPRRTQQKRGRTA